jgi:hypothetical protein
VIRAKRYGYFEITHFKRVFPAQHINSILHTGKVQVPVYVAANYENGVTWYAVRNSETRYDVLYVAQLYLRTIGA